MKQSKKWEIVSEFKIDNAKLKIKNLLKMLLENRGIKTQQEQQDFLQPQLQTVTLPAVGITQLAARTTIKRLQQAIDNQEQIVVFGDYDVDGITGTAILWESLYALGANVLPYIPSRIEEGYGLSSKGIENCKLQVENCSLIITVDNGIVAHKAVDFANKNKIDVIITDHHVPSSKLPAAKAIFHSTKLCGAGVAWLLMRELAITNHKLKAVNDTHLELVALATVADLVPLTASNRTLLKFGLDKLRQTRRVGLLALCAEAQIKPEEIDVYQIGHILAPRLNAMGRISNAMDSLRLLCTKDPARAKKLSLLIDSTNKERQILTQELTAHAITKLKIENGKLKIKNLLFIAHETYDQGIIGLIAGRLVEEFYRPAIVLSIGEKYSKASARSIKGFNMIEFIRSASEFLIDAGGHPMAAGFTVETVKIEILKARLELLAEELIKDSDLIPYLKVDCELELGFLNQELYDSLQTLAPFGMANPEPTFVGRGVVIEDIRNVGMEGKHLKLRVSQQQKGVILGSTATPESSQETDSGRTSFASMTKNVFEAIGFGLSEKGKTLKIGDKVDIVYTLDENVWNGNKSLQLKVKDLKSI